MNLTSVLAAESTTSMGRSVYCQYNILHVDNIHTVKEEFLVDLHLKAMWVVPEKERLQGRLLHRVNEINYKGVDPNGWQYLWNPKLFFVNLVERKLEERTYRLERRADILYVVESIHIIGTFGQKFSLRHFPFDYQHLSIMVQSQLPNTKICLIPLLDGKKISAVARFADVRHEWGLSSYTDCRLEKTLAEHSNSRSCYPRLNIKFCIRRSAKYYIWNVIFVNFLIIALSFTSLTVDYKETGDRLNVTMILLLTTIAFKFAMSEILPNVPYLTFLDKYIISGISFNSLVTVQNAVVSLVEDKAAFEFWSLIVLACVFGVMHIMFAVKTVMVRRSRREALSRLRIGGVG